MTIEPSFFSNWTLAIMVIKDANYYTTQHDLKAITLVDQDYSSRHGQKKRAEVWNLCKRLVEHPQNELLPEVHKKVKDFACCCGCKKVVKYGGSASPLADHVHSKSCKTDPAAKAKVPSGRRWNMDAETFNCIVLQHNWLERDLMWVIDDPRLIVCLFFFASVHNIFCYNNIILKIFSCHLTPRCFAP